MMKLLLQLAAKPIFFPSVQSLAQNTLLRMVASLCKALIEIMQLRRQAHTGQVQCQATEGPSARPESANSLDIS